jgi:hypothetical protein
MSAYFQRLINLSGLVLQQPVPAAHTPKASPHFAAADVHDAVEVQQEHVVEGEVSGAPARSSNQSLPSVPGQAATPMQSSASSRRVHFGETTPLVEETVVVTSTAASLRPTSQSQPPTRSLPRSEDSTISSGPQPEISRDVFESVMKWIAAGQARTPNTPTLTTPEPSPSAADIATPEIRPSLPSTPAKIPDRVIEISEELVGLESARPSRAAESPRSADAELPRNGTPAESAVRVSIGSINVRIEAPAPPAQPPVTSKRPVASARTTAPAIRAAGFSKLRRHYIIPH